jgi:uncharacterized protein
MGTTRVAAAAALCAAALLVTAQPASAHVSIQGEGTKGGFSIVTFSVPNERADASTSTVEVQVPQDQAIPFVSPQPKPGWTVTTTMRTLAKPVDAEGESITDVVDTVKWTGGTIAPGQFDLFSISAGPLPDDLDELAFPAIQTYSDGEAVRWIDPTPASGEEPEHPVPVLTLVDAPAGSDHHGEATTTTASDGGEQAAATEGDDSDDSKGLATAALVIAILGLAAGGGALVMARRRPS